MRKILFFCAEIIWTWARQTFDFREAVFVLASMIQKVKFPCAECLANVSKQLSRTIRPNIFTRNILLNKREPTRNRKKKRPPQFPVPNSQLFWRNREAPIDWTIFFFLTIQSFFNCKTLLFDTLHMSYHNKP